MLKLSGICLNSLSLGLRLTLTTHLRQHEAGMLEMGEIVNYFQVIPPGEKDFVTKSYCHENCLKLVSHA